MRDNGPDAERDALLLESQLSHFCAVDITIQAGYRREDIRNDGWPRSSARPLRRLESFIDAIVGKRLTYRRLTSGVAA